MDTGNSIGWTDTDKDNNVVTHSLGLCWWSTADYPMSNNVCGDFYIWKTEKKPIEETLEERSELHESSHRWGFFYNDCLSFVELELPFMLMCVHLCVSVQIQQSKYKSSEQWLFLDGKKNKTKKTKKMLKKNKNKKKQKKRQNDAKIKWNWAITDTELRLLFTRCITACSVLVAERLMPKSLLPAHGWN